MKRQKKYNSEFERFYDNALMFAKCVFRKRLIPLTDVEDVAMEAAETVLFANERGAFRRARNRQHRWEMQKNRLEELVRNAARKRRTQKAMVSLNAFDGHNRLTQRFDEDGGDVESEEAWLAEQERIVSDLGMGAMRVRDFATRVEDPWWLAFFEMKVEEINRAKVERKPDKTPKELEAERVKVDERIQLNRLRYKIGLTQRKPKKELPWMRQVIASLALRRDFGPARYVYHRECAANRIVGR